MEDINIDLYELKSTENFITSIVETSFYHGWLDFAAVN